MSAPVEFRNYMRKWERNHAMAGIAPINDGRDLYLAPMFQYRYKMRLKTENGFEMIWSEWQDIPLAKEGQEATPPNDPEVA